MIQFNAENWGEPQSLYDYLDYVCGEELDENGRPFHSPSLDRKCRLLVVAALRAVWDAIPDARSRTAIELFEQFADDLDSAKNEEAESLARQAADDAEVRDEAGNWIAQRDDYIAQFVYQAVGVDSFGAAVDFIRYSWVNVLDEINSAGGRPYKVGNAFHLRLFHDIFGNPFRPVALDPTWRTSDVLALARGIYEERAFDRMPILADALQDAGCANEDILAHCRDLKQVHVRGCWVVDLVLGKA